MSDTRGHYNQGEQSPNAKLTDDVVRHIRRDVAEGECQAAVARHYGVSPTTVCRIVKGEAWAHVP